MRILVSGDHAASNFMGELKEALEKEGYEIFLTPGAKALCGESVDYPDMAAELCNMFLAGQKGEAEAEKFDFGLLICGTGIGMSLSANKFKGIRAANVENELCAELARSHNDANVLCLGARILGPELALAICKRFFSTEFSGGRHARRVGKIEAN